VQLAVRIGIYTGLVVIGEMGGGGGCSSSHSKLCRLGCGCSSSHSKLCRLGCLRDFAIFSMVYQRGITEINRV
jgi:hypothetical protein